jgi:hypothetical protein
MLWTALRRREEREATSNNHQTLECVPEVAQSLIGGHPMIAGAKYGHTNLIAKDWRALARFYEEQFGCTPVPPERDFKGSDLERGRRSRSSATTF